MAYFEAVGRRRVAILVGVLAAIAVPVALANMIDNVVVGVPGRNDTRGFSQKLFVRVMVENDYSKVDFDGDHGDWVGPPYHGTEHPNLGGTAKVSWTAYFDKGISLEQALQKHFVHGWPRTQEFRIEVPHVTHNVRVASINGTYRITKSPGEHDTQFEGVLSFPLCKKVVGSVEFAFLEPFSEVTGLGDFYRVYVAPSDKDAMSWNHDNAVLAASYVAVDGYFPAGKVTAGPPNVHVAGQPPHEIAGFVTDCSGAPMPGVPVHAAKARTTTNARGFYLLRMPKAGNYVVVATGGGASVRRRVHIS